MSTNTGKARVRSNRRPTPAAARKSMTVARETTSIVRPAGSGLEATNSAGRIIYQLLALKAKDSAGSVRPRLSVRKGLGSAGPVTPRTEKQPAKVVVPKQSAARAWRLDKSKSETTDK